MALTSAVRCLLLTVLLIFKLSGKLECLTIKVKDGEQTERSIEYYKTVTYTPQTEAFLKKLHRKTSIDSFNPETTDDNALYDSGEKQCQHTLCQMYDKYRVRRQIQTGYPSYPQPTHTRQGPQYQNNGYRPPTNNYGDYPNVNNIYSHYPNQTQYRPSYNSTLKQWPNRNNSSYPNPGFSSSSRHTYPPSPRPLYNQYSSNNRSNITQSANNLYPYNKYPTSIPSFYNASYSSPQNYYPTYNGNPHPNVHTNLTSPRFGQNNTRETFNHRNNLYTTPNYNYYNVTHYPYNKPQNNSSPYNNLTQRAPFNPYQSQGNRNSTYLYNFAPSRGVNSTHGNNYNPVQYYPSPNFTQNTPFSTSPNLPQNKFPANPNPFYYPSNYNGPQYDPLRQPPERLSY